MNTLDNNLTELLNTEVVDAISQPETPKQLVAQPQEENEVLDDADYARTNLYCLIEKGNETIESISEIAKESMHPRAFEVLGQLMKTQSENLDKLMKLQKDKRELLRKEEEARPAQQGNGINVEQAVFVGSTTELLKALKNEKIR